MRRLITGILLGAGVCSILWLLPLSSESDFLIKEQKSRYAQREDVFIETYNSQKEKIHMKFDTIPARVIVVEYNNLETMLALGLGDCVVGARVVPKVASFQRLKRKYPGELNKIANKFPDEISREMAIGLQPDFILGWRSTFSNKYLGSTDWWNARGVKTYIVATSNRTIAQGAVEDEIKYLREMGRIFQREKEAGVYIQHIQGYLKDVQRKVKNKPAPRVMIIEGMGGRIANYSETWLAGDMVRKLGGIMIAKENMLGIEDLIEYNPDVVFVVYYSASTEKMVKTVLTDPKYNSIQAVRMHRVYGIPLYCMYSTGVATIEGLNILARGMYPELVEDPELTKWSNMDQ